MIPLIFCQFSIINLIENNEFTGFQEFSAPLSLRSVDFYKATLNNINLNGTILLNSELNKSKGLDLVQFTGTNPPLLCATSLPSNMKHLSGDRDCDRLPEVLQKKYPDRFKTLEKAKQYVESAQKARQNSRRI